MTRSPPFTPREIGEVAIACRDLDAMSGFYRDVIGLPVIEGAYSDRVRFHRVADGFAGHIRVVALFEAERAEAEASTLHHLGLTVTEAELDPAEVWFRERADNVWTATHDWAGWRSVYVADPEGNTVELVAAMRA